MSRTKVALDANIPQRLVRILNAAFGDKDYDFVHEPDFASAGAEDEVWAAVFQRLGGRIVISADRNIAKRPHQLSAFARTGLITFFLDARWHHTDMSHKAAHLILWWPRMAAHCDGCSPGDCWWVPASLREEKFKRALVPRPGSATERAR